MSMQEVFGAISPTSLYRQENDQHRLALERLLAGAIQTTNQWIANLQDPELGRVGQIFQTNSVEAGFRETIDIHHHGRFDGRADYISFDYKKGFVNHLVYGPAAADDLMTLFSCKVHEGTHGIQKRRSAALHASPFNPNTRIIVCPRDWITLQERCEQDAYVKQAWFNSLLMVHLPELREKSELDALSADTFNAIRSTSPKMVDTVTNAARQALSKSWYWDNPDAADRFLNHYQDYALNNYTAGMDMRRGNHETGLIFVRIEPQDIAAIGASCGPNSFGTNGLLTEFLEKPQLLQETRQKLCALNVRLGIEDEERLPLLGEVLSNYGISRLQYIESTYTNRAITAPQVRQHNSTPAF